MPNLEFGDRIPLKTIDDATGSLTVFEPDVSGSFEIRRLYYLHNLSPGAERGGHAHLRLYQFFIAISGEFTIELERAGKTRRVHANSPREAIYVPPVTWRTITGFSLNAVCLVLASEVYDDDDYIRDFDRFLAIS